jgi:hypothetical protein
MLGARAVGPCSCLPPANAVKPYGRGPPALLGFLVPWFFVVGRTDGGFVRSVFLCRARLSVCRWLWAVLGWVGLA